MPRKDLSLAEKLKILDTIRQLPENTSNRSLSEILKIPKSTIGRIRASEEIIRQQNISGTSGVQLKRKRKGKDPIIDEALSQWFTIVTESGIRVSGPMLKSKAEEFGKMLGHEHENFKATEGWLSRWKKRHDIKLKNFHGEKGSAEVISADKWNYETLPDILKSFSPENIYNADETGLFYRATPDGSLCFNKDNLAGSKKAMERITILCCTNMTGSDKRKLLVIGNSKKPRVFTGLDIKRLPVEYQANSNAQMTSLIFLDWLKKWDKELQRQGKFIILILENCFYITPYTEDLKNIKLEFLPPNTTSLKQPLDMGIIENLKTKYRAKLVNFILEKIEENLLNSNSTAKEVSSKVNILQSIHFIADSWNEIDSQTIRNCFAHWNFKLSAESLEENPENVADILIKAGVQNVEEFINLDHDLACRDDQEHTDEDIVDAMKEDKQETEKSDSDEESETKPVSLPEARNCIEKLRHFFLQKGNEESPLDALNKCANYVTHKSTNKVRQCALDSFL